MENHDTVRELDNDAVVNNAEHSANVVDNEDSEGNRDDEDDIEEFFVVVDFPELEGTNLLQQTKKIKLSNVLGDQVVCELDGHVFTGEHDFSLGSRILLNTEASKDEFVVGNTARCITMHMSKINSER